jgi:hypothetical protein
MDKEKTELQDAMDFLLDIAERHYPKYHESDRIAEILDLYKELWG